MTSKAWNKLKKGSIIKGIGKNGISRKVIGRNFNSNQIVLRAIRNGTYKLWSGFYKTIISGKDEVIYSPCDKLSFKVIKY